MTRLILQDGKFRRHTLVRERINKSIHALCVGIQRSVEVRRQMSGGLFENSCEPEHPLSLVLRQGRLANNLRQFTADCAPQQIHLPQTIAGRYIALCEIEIVIVGCFDV